MMNTLLWIETLLVTTLLMALAIAGVQRWPLRRWRVPVLILAALVPVLLVPTPLAAFAIFLHAHLLVVPIAALSALVVAALICQALLVWRSLRAPPWPAGRLTLALIGALVLLGTTFTQAEHAVLVRAQSQRGEALAVVASVMPAAVPDALNAAIPYQRAAKAADQLKLDSLDPDPHLAATTWSDDDPRWRDMAVKFAPWQGIFADLVEGGQRPACWFDRDWSDQFLFSLVFEEQGGLRNAARALGLQTRVQLATGDAEGAWRSLITLTRLAEHYQGEPFLINRFTAASYDGLAFTAATAGLRRCRPEQLPDPNAIPAAHPWERRFRHALIVEQAAGIQAMQRTGTCAEVFPVFGMLNGVPEPVSRWISHMVPLYTILLLEDDIADYRDHMQRLRRMLKEGDMAKLHEEEGLLLAQAREGRSHLLSHMLMPAIFPCVHGFARAEAQRSLIRLGIALRRQRAATGAWPTLGADLPALRWPRDPFTGQPMPAALRDGGVVLWSVGSDLKDDQGLVEQRKTSDPGDVVLRIAP